MLIHKPFLEDVIHFCQWLDHLFVSGRAITLNLWRGRLARADTENGGKLARVHCQSLRYHLQLEDFVLKPNNGNAADNFLCYFTI